MEIVPYRLRKVSLKKISLGWKSQGSWRRAEQRQQAQALWHSSSSHFLYEMNSQRRPGKKFLKRSVLWLILPVNSAGRISDQPVVFSLKAKLIKYGPYTISLAAGTGSFLVTSEELVKDVYSQNWLILCTEWFDTLHSWYGLGYPETMNYPSVTDIKSLSRWQCPLYAIWS